MANDFDTPGAIFLFLVLIGVLNLLFKIAARTKTLALGFAGLATAAWIYTYQPFFALDIHSPGLIFSTFLLISFTANIFAVWRGKSLALNRAELILVYAMLLIVSALCTMGLGEQLLPIITAIFYFASPENQWEEKLFPHFPKREILVNDGNGNKALYEGVAKAGESIPYGEWVEPLFWWGVFLLALYMAMLSIAVILRRQWMERERLAYPVAQVGLAMVRGEDSKQLVNGFFKRYPMWIGCAIPMVYGSLKGLNRYEAAVPIPQISWNIALEGIQNLHLGINFATLGFSYLIHTQIALGICFFHLLSKFEKSLFVLTGLKSSQKIIYGAAEFTFLGYQGAGALVGMVLVGFWIGRVHLKNVFMKAVGRAPEVDDGDEVLSYCSAVIGAVGGVF